MRNVQQYAALLATLLVAAQATAQLAAEPASVTMTSPTQRMVINLKANGSALTATDIHGWRLTASGINYTDLVDVKNNDGVLEVTPRAPIAVGNYVLRVETSQGSIAVPIYAQMAATADELQRRTGLADAANGKVLSHYGLTTISPRADVPLTLESMYYEGQTITVTMTPVPTSTYTWFVNGVVVAEGVGANQLVYTFGEAGYYVITGLESQVTNGTTVITTRAAGATTVVPYPGVIYTAHINVPANLPGPKGYLLYAWTVDGEAVGDSETLIYTFGTLGTHSVECKASSPSPGTVDQFVRVAYNVTVIP